MLPNKMHEIYVWAVVTARIRIEAVKFNDYDKITATHTVDAAVIQYLNKFKLKGTDVKILNYIFTFWKIKRMVGWSSRII